ncbi:uncharacterized protein LOC130998249 [Salvia miltiorrhiza]|uniref:uncharacterized protein LOC130998249 n=1 Tax=Salvia miltiorrhiza TaxID=226208 RepID=UPI0025AD016D|nr:uncharacterized protein LOC130998249 [Salvia miltiorrhiza]
MTLRHRLVSGTDLLQDIDHRSHIILDAEFFTYLDREYNELMANARRMFSSPSEQRFINSEAIVMGWQPHANRMYSVYGRGTSSSQGDWMDAIAVIVPVFVLQRFVICSIDMLTGKCRVFDPNLYRILAQERHDMLRALAPLGLLFYRVLEVSLWFERTRIVENPRQNLEWRQLQIEYADPAEQFTQADRWSSGVFACMAVERLIADSPSLSWGNDHVQEYRHKIGSAIYEFCTTPNTL